MTDENNPADEPDDELEDVQEALEDTGVVEPPSDDAEAEDDDESTSLLDKLESLSGTGESLENYDDDPVAAVFSRGFDETPRGAKHIARGVDGLSPLSATHPLVDIGVGFVLLKAEQRQEGVSGGNGKDATEAPGEDGDDSHYRGDMLS